MFTKVLKQPFGLLRSQGHHGVVYDDDSFLQGQSFEACQEYVWVTAHFLKKLGFTIHPDKYILTSHADFNFFEVLFSLN